MTLTCHMGEKVHSTESANQHSKKIIHITNSEIHASPQWLWAVLEITENTNKSFQLQFGTKC